MNAKQAPEKYRTTWIAVIVVMVFTILAALVLRVLWARENARRNKDALASTVPAARPESVWAKEGGGGSQGSQTSVLDGVMQVDRDLTDWDDRTFRYSL